MMKVVPTRIGAAFQAEIPPLLTPQERQKQREEIDERPPYRARWTPAPHALSDDEVTEYLRGSRLNETEAALRCLHDSGFDVHKGTQLLVKHRHQRVRATAQRTSALSDDDFESAMLAHGKCFFAIQRQHPKTRTPDLVARFYLWKTSTAYKKWHERAKTKKNKEAARLRQWADAEGESDTSDDFHNEHCELCFTGGQLLCCDGCERAYHFSCAEPPIKDVPQGDWFCVACAAILATNTEQKASDENPFCDEVVVVLHGPSSSSSSQRNLPAEDEVMEEEEGVATDGNDTEEIEDTSMADDHHHKTPSETVVVKQETVVHPHARLYTPERLASVKRSSSGDHARTGTPTRSPLLLESTNRKRQRKIVAPRRIPQSDPPQK